tara:strand:+ start:4030 stop:4536 length:507 start_codon:yes stop_codon:yes gene_type:complete
MEERETKWSPIKAISRAKKNVDLFGIPIFDPNLPKEHNLLFGDLATYPDNELEKFLIVYGGYKASLETKLADIEAAVGALEAAFTEGYNTSVYAVAKEYEESGKKKPNKDELRGEVMTRFEALREQKKDIIDQSVELKKFQGLLNTYTTAYQTVSRVVTLRTKRAESI